MPFAIEGQTMKNGRILSGEETLPLLESVLVKALQEVRSDPEGVDCLLGDKTEVLKEVVFSTSAGYFRILFKG